ncbi:MAG TPA: LL-diaminopimelate aminotransferase [Chthoniobacterales bacterium]
MAYLNENFLKLQAGYLFPEIARRVRVALEERPASSDRLIRCGIGDVTEPLPRAAIQAMHRAVDEMGSRDTFRGYGPEQGYEFLRHAIGEHDYRLRGLEVTDDEIFVSDGSKCDGGNVLDILGGNNRIAVMDPVYPVYVDTNVMAGHTGPARKNGSYEGLVYLPCVEANGFVPDVPDEKADLIYLCYPNNPTGVVATRAELERWVAYAQQHRALILFDAAYEAYITDQAIPHSIYEIPGATECAIELRSFSKNGGFTGLRCAYTVLPRALRAWTMEGESLPLYPLWQRRFSTKFNGVSYPVQRAAEALYTEEGKAEVKALVAHYLENAAILADAIRTSGLTVFGGVNAPYLWVKAPSGYRSWGIFDKLLREIQVVITPGAGFGASGEGYFRVSAFNSRANAEEVARRFSQVAW